ncbi:hypothetical protein [Arthrobacter woluwensis]|jgi:hypothetical protein|uniref:hypothetical protein n=1 Tax=Arthrobacter woluwensis TaxID=156980 RepID=UPI001AAE9F06|nr:hypothetical protein [Arthrobacter woluwensis]QTF73117.1 hypothetical protein G8758_14760 [Arthrobacter woluwensis]
MTNIPFTQARADQIVAGVNQTDAAAFAAVLALPDNLVPLPAVAANTSWPADARIDASTFVANGSAGVAQISSKGLSAELSLVLQDDVWKIAPSGAYGNEVEAAR